MYDVCIISANTHTPIYLFILVHSSRKSLLFVYMHHDIHTYVSLYLCRSVLLNMSVLIVPLSMNCLSIRTTKTLRY